MALTLDSPYRTREIEVPPNIIRAQKFTSHISDIRRLPLPRPPSPRPPPNENFYPPAFTRSRRTQGSEITGDEAGAPSHTIKARPRWRLKAQSPTGPQMHNCDERTPGNDGLEPPDQGFLIGGASGRPHRNDNQGVQHSNATQNSGDSQQRTSSPCLICLDVPDEFPHDRPSSSCTHESTICASCLEQYISHGIQSEGLTTLICPDSECRRVMEYSDVVRGSRRNRECLDRYEGLLRLRRLEKEPNFVRCKNPTCNWGQIHGMGAAIPMVVCQVCHAGSCFTHDIPWHTDLTCEQYTATQQAKRAAEDQANRAYIEQHAKVCPNPSCGRWIEKTEGCDHMTCRRPAGCGHEFCWSCFADYQRIHKEGSHCHATSCRHYAPQREQNQSDIHVPRRRLLRRLFGR